jgi:hypothetical protein
MSYKYNVKVGVVTQRIINYKKTAFGFIAALTMAGAMAVPALAASNSTPGIDRYLANPGRQQATEVGAQCGSGAGSGAFGFLGKDNNEAGGADGTQTGINNSAVCGNRP